MTNILKFLGVAIAGIVVGLLLHAGGASNVGGIYNQVQQNFQNGGLIIGPSGSSLTQVIKGTGSLIAPSYVSLAASTTLAADIAVTGVVSGDTVFAQFATSTALGAGWEVVNASASSTAGYITVRFINNTGTAATIPASVASTTQYLIIR